MYRNKARHTATFGEFTAHRVTWALGRHHDHVHAGLRINQTEMHVQAVGKRDCRTFTDIVVHVFLVGFCLQFVGHGKHDHIAPSCCFGDPHNLQAFALSFLGRGRAFTQRHNKVLGAAVTQVQRVRMALRTVAKNGDFLVFDQVDVTVTVVIDAHGFSSERC